MGFLMFYGETGVKYSCFGAGARLALFFLCIHLVFIQMNFLLVARLEWRAVMCPFSSVPVRAREVTLPDCVLCPFWVGNNTRYSLQLQIIIIVKMQICYVITRISEFVTWHSQSSNCCSGCPSRCGRSELPLPLTCLYLNIYAWLSTFWFVSL